MVRITEPDYADSYVVTEQRPDGSLVLAPESVEHVVNELADRPLSEAEQDEMFDRLDAAADRDSGIDWLTPPLNVAATRSSGTAQLGAGSTLLAG